MKNILELNEDELTAFAVSKIVQYVKDSGQDAEDFPYSDFLKWFNEVIVGMTLLNLLCNDQIVLSGFNEDPIFVPAENAQLTGIWKDIFEIQMRQDSGKISTDF